MNVPQKILSQPLFLVALRCVIGFVFVYAAIEKISQPTEFARAIANYHLLPQFSVNIVTLVLPWMELLAGLALIGGVYVKGSSLLLGILLTVFSCAVALALIRGLDISCGCFGTSSASKVGWTHLVENVAMMAGSWIVFSASPNNVGPSRPSRED